MLALAIPMGVVLVGAILLLIAIVRLDRQLARTQRLLESIDDDEDDEGGAP